MLRSGIGGLKRNAGIRHNASYIDQGAAALAEVLDRVTHGGDLRRMVVASQTRAAAGIRATDFGALILDRLRPVLECAPPAR